MFQAASSFTWFDHNEQDRQKMLDIITLFSEKKSRDELGIGSVRDALADMLFPGTSTIQTRARYFLFAPYVYRALERKGVNSGEIAHRARRQEAKLIDALLQSADTDGVIGKRAGRHVQRLPSNIYWAGLRTWGIFLDGKSQEQYHTYLDHFYRIHRQARERAREENTTAEYPHNWHANLPPTPTNFPNEATFALTPEESHYLRERIITSAPASLLAYLVSQDVGVIESAEFAWHIAGDLTALHQRQLHHARLFSTAMYGAALLYNLMLAEMTRSEELETVYSDAQTEWLHEVDLSELRDWDRPDFWQMVRESNPRVPALTEQFCDAWIDLLLQGAHDQSARELIQKREYRRKRNKARLHNPRARELWSGASGINQLNYRWPQVQRILTDILTPLATFSHA